MSARGVALRRTFVVAGVALVAAGLIGSAWGLATRGPQPSSTSAPSCLPVGDITWGSSLQRRIFTQVDRAERSGHTWSGVVPLPADPEVVPQVVAAAAPAGFSAAILRAAEADAHLAVTPGPRRRSAPPEFPEGLPDGEYLSFVGGVREQVPGTARCSDGTTVAFTLDTWSEPVEGLLRCDVVPPTGTFSADVRSRC